MIRSVTEYCITYEGHDKEDIFTEIKEEADEVFMKTKENVRQYFKKEWIIDEENSNLEEGDVEVCYSRP